MVTILMMMTATIMMITMMITMMMITMMMMMMMMINKTIVPVYGFQFPTSTFSMHEGCSEKLRENLHCFVKTPLPHFKHVTRLEKITKLDKNGHTSREK